MNRPNAQQLRQKVTRISFERTENSPATYSDCLGSTLDLCPVLDISFDDEADNSLRGRCWGISVPRVIRFAGAFHDGLLRLAF